MTFTSTFTFATRQFDDEFHALDKIIADTAKSIPGYLGEETWENATAGLVSNVYYWDGGIAHPLSAPAVAAPPRSS